MKWKKLGQIFEFEKSPIAQKFVSHVQSPQAVVFDDFVRVYFSTRKKEDNGKFVSHVQYIDSSKDFKNIINFSKHEVISVGETGTFNEHGIFPFNPLKLEDKFYGYTTGWTRRRSVDVDSGIGLSISDDNGETFKKLGGGPVLTSSLYEPFLVCDGFVRKFKDKFYMFYIFGQKWCQESQEQAPERVYKIGYATSEDGINWIKANRCIIEDKIDENECQALPTVIKIGERYHMYFCYRHMVGFRTDKEKGYRLGYAYSDDLINWTREDENAGITTSEGAWDSDMMCYPNLVEINDKIYLLYNGNEFGKHGFGVAELEGV